MTNKVYIPNEDIVVNKAEKPQKVLDKQTKKKNWDKFKEPYLFRKWHLSNLRGYISDEFRNLRFTN